jgi:hypothetical protein
LDFLDVYGKPSAQDRELRFSGFRTETYLQNPDAGTIIPDLNRSGRRYQICYNLKTVVKKPPTDQHAATGSWKIRQEVIIHQFDVGSGTQLWIYGDPHAVIKDRIRVAVSDRKDHKDKFETVSQSFTSSFNIHLEGARWSTEGWRLYIVDLEETIENLVRQRNFLARVFIWVMRLLTNYVYRLLIGYCPKAAAGLVWIQMISSRYQSMRTK